MDINNYISSGIIEMYVMGLCSAEEKTELELLRLQYPQLNTAIIQFETELENNLQQSPTLPGEKTDTKILQALHNLQIPIININTASARIKKINWFKPVAAAAIILLTASSIYNYSLYKKNKEQQTALTQLKENISGLPQADYAILKSPTITPVALYGVYPHSICRCTLFWDKKTGKAYMMIHHLVRSTQEKKYQLWAMVNDKPVNVGMVNDAIRDRFIELQNVPAGATAFSVTLENAAGVATPTIAETYVYGKI
ncbi:anti-sigma factor domain-containing protein [Ferruginibacter sp.]|nr:anti-sigma factor [Ferruginibacter sp.]